MQAPAPIAPDCDRRLPLFVLPALLDDAAEAVEAGIIGVVAVDVVIEGQPRGHGRVGYFEHAPGAEVVILDVFARAPAVADVVEPAEQGPVAAGGIFSCRAA